MTEIYPPESTPLAICGLSFSTAKGQPHETADSLRVTLNGIEGDRHAGPGLRQISMMHENVLRDRFPDCIDDVRAGKGQENILLSGEGLAGLRILDTLEVGDATLEITQIGLRVNETGKALCSANSTCLLSDFGVFARVVHAGDINCGTPVHHQKRLLRAHIITVSDRASSGKYADKSGPRAQELLEAWCVDNHWEIWIESQIVPDDREVIAQALGNARQSAVDVVITTGGTGVGPRDVTPDVIAAHADRLIPGIMDFIRLKYGADMPLALTSRSVAAVMGTSLVYALPGSPKAVAEYLEEIFKSMEHMLFILKGIDAHGRL